MRAFAAILPLVPAVLGVGLTVRTTTCNDDNHAKTAATDIKGTFQDICPWRSGVNYGNECAYNNLGAQSNGQTTTHTYDGVSGSTDYVLNAANGAPDNGPGCYRITTVSSDGWKICGLEIVGTNGGAHNLGGTWTWTGAQWFDNPCNSYSYGAPCATSHDFCYSSGAAGWNYVAYTSPPTTRPPTTDYPTTLAPTNHHCTAVVHQHGDYGGTDQTYVGPTSQPFTAGTGNTHENGQASSMKITGSPGCEVRIFCHAGATACWYHSNSPCNDAGNCADANGNWDEVYTVPASGSLDISFLQHNDPRHAYINIRPTGFIGVSGDPFTTDAQGNKVQFFLPLQKEQLLLKCQAVQLYGRAFTSGIVGDHQQWFDAFRVVFGGEEVLRVEVSKKDKLLVPAGTKVSDDIDVSRGNYSKTTSQKGMPLTTVAVAVIKQAMTQTGVVAYNGIEVDVARNEAKRIGGGWSEVVDIVMGSTRLAFTSAAATKFTSKTEQALYTHLDARFESLDTKTCTAGVLAEIWGVVKMSSETTAMLQSTA